MTITNDRMADPDAIEIISNAVAGTRSGQCVLASSPFQGGAAAPGAF